MSNCLPSGYKELVSPKSYWKMGDMKQGDNKLRIVKRPIAGWLDWIDKKPRRFRPEEKPLAPFDPTKPIKAFWSMYVWDYERKGLYILEVTQASILKALTAYAEDVEWGDFTGYDIKIKKEGSSKETRYSVTAVPHKEMSAEIKQALIDFPVRLEALYSNGDPWTDLEGAVDEEYVPPPFMDIDEELVEHVRCAQIDTTLLNAFVEMNASNNKCTREDVIKGALRSPTWTEKFLKTYSQYVTSKA